MSIRAYRPILAAAVLSLAAAAQADVLVTANSAAVADNPKNRAIAQCVRAIYDHWPKNAGLMLPNRGRMRIDHGMRTITISGSVWRHGQRQSVDHECRAQVRGAQLALSVAPSSSSGPLEIAAQFQ